MAIRVKARNGESVEQMLRRFKKLCEKEGLTKEIKRRRGLDQAGVGGAILFNLLGDD
jgi:ribosomal protein S21